MLKLSDAEVLQLAVSSGIFTVEKDDKITVGLKNGSTFASYFPQDEKPKIKLYGTDYGAMLGLLYDINMFGSKEQKKKAEHFRELVSEKIDKVAEW